MSNLFQDSIIPIDLIGNRIMGKRALEGLGIANTGCPPKGSPCSGSAAFPDCVDFCCFPGVEIQNIIQKKSAGQYLYTLCEAALSFIPGVGIALAVFELVKPVVNWANRSLNKKRLVEEQKVIDENNMKALGYNFQAWLECQIGFCNAIKTIQKNPAWATNGVFGSQGPEIAKLFIENYVISAINIQNQRWGKTTQKVLSVRALRNEDQIKEAGIMSGDAIIQVPNIEHYWQHDKINIPGFGWQVVAHRHGKSPKKITAYCDNIFVHQDIYPGGLLGKCKLSMTANYEGIASGGGTQTGWNNRSMSGPGLLLVRINYAANKSKFDALVGKNIELYNPVYIDLKGTGTPKAQTPKPTGTPAPDQNYGNNPEPLTEVKKASFMGNFPGLILMGIGLFMLASALSGDSEKMLKEEQ